jgi:hypothetical protein
MGVAVVRNRSVGRSALVGLVVAVSVLVAVVAGCASQSSAEVSGTGAKPMGSAAQTQTGGGTMAKKMTCPMCNKGAPAVEKGAAKDENGVQVARITLKGEYYSPNQIEIKAGVPAKLIFSGNAKDCAGKPKIAALNKQVDFTKTGEATMDLGALSPGTYQLTCGMDSPGGSIIVR